MKIVMMNKCKNRLSQSLSLCNNPKANGKNLLGSVTGIRGDVNFQAVLQNASSLYIQYRFHSWSSQTGQLVLHVFSNIPLWMHFLLII